MKADVISTEHIVMIAVAITTGTLARILTVKEDFRQYPSYPNGYMTNLVTGFIASALGAVAIPALMTKNFIAVTFLTLAIQQFRDVRKAERESLKDLENTEYTSRGDAYIDGIAKTFEARNYFALIVSFCTALAIQAVNSQSIPIRIAAGVISGVIVLFILKRFSKGKTIGDIASVEQGSISIKETDLYVDDIFVTNFLGSENASSLFESEGIAAVLTPNEDRFRITLDHRGQQQAALFEATRTLGLKRYHFTRKDFDNGKVIITFVPILKDSDRLLEAIKKTPLLESTKKNKDVLRTNFVGRN
ncbi:MULTISPECIES: YIEGIA family protein [unclassified Bacillus (in: firmicutes)]|uniref:YIEGIA family protein n=1 Tax=unclassified Bacillus (in: firmicutes) TaxID=185979 RepID=UPI001BE59597|nr:MULTISPECIES: YIEGIA family protein [unclassified Bacillus (in: firmicutes)]MBT2637862.1 YIEGIA family protein [Bacillus sp. ISL-39]MBT2661034.1 YIEGIA family protein [Bacillus sp. ISL-45]